MKFQKKMTVNCNPEKGLITIDCDCQSANINAGEQESCCNSDKSSDLINCLKNSKIEINCNCDSNCC